MTACGLGLAMGLGLLAATEFLGEETLHDMLTFNPGNFFTYVLVTLRQLVTNTHSPFARQLCQLHTATCPAPDVEKVAAAAKLIGLCIMLQVLPAAYHLQRGSVSAQEVLL